MIICLATIRGRAARHPPDAGSMSVRRFSRRHMHSTRRAVLVGPGARRSRNRRARATSWAIGTRKVSRKRSSPVLERASRGCASVPSLGGQVIDDLMQEIVHVGEVDVEVDCAIPACDRIFTVVSAIHALFVQNEKARRRAAAVVFRASASIGRYVPSATTPPEFCLPNLTRFRRRRRRRRSPGPLPNRRPLRWEQWVRRSSVGGCGAVPSWVVSSMSPFATETPPKPPAFELGPATGPCRLPRRARSGRRRGHGVGRDSSPRCRVADRVDDAVRVRGRVSDPPSGDPGTGLVSTPPRRSRDRRPCTGLPCRDADECRPSTSNRLGAAPMSWSGPVGFVTEYAVTGRELLVPGDFAGAVVDRDRASPTGTGRLGVRLAGADEGQVPIRVDGGRRPHGNAMHGAGRTLTRAIVRRRYFGVEADDAALELGCAATNTWKEALPMIQGAVDDDRRRPDAIEGAVSMSMPHRLASARTVDGEHHACVAGDVHRVLGDERRWLSCDLAGSSSIPWDRSSASTGRGCRPSRRSRRRRR